MKKTIGFPFCFFVGATLAFAAPSWLDRVSPLIGSIEKKAYLGLQPRERADFEERFWTDKAIASDEYYRRLDHIDAVFGSNRTGSGANTDPGRVYLALGPPARVTHIPSSRVFVPLEIWYYDSVPGLLNTELRLIFYQPNSLGLPKLYSPVLDTIRALLVPQAGTRSLFGPNGSITESSIRQALKLGPAEDEVITASVNVASGIRYSGNDEIVGRITSPEQMLGKAQRTRVNSRLIVSKPKLDMMQTASHYGGSQVDFQWESVAQHELDLEVLQGTQAVYRNQVHLKFSKPQPVTYMHRLDLLPGAYRVLFTVDGTPYPYAIEVPQQPGMGEIVRVDLGEDGKRLEFNAAGRFVAVALARPGPVKWSIRKGNQVVWRSVSDGQEIATVELPFTRLAPGAYAIEAVSENDSRSATLLMKPDAESSANLAVIRFNANLAPASRHAFVGRQWLLRGKVDQARQSLQASLAKAETEEAQIELARVDALTGSLDAARDHVRTVLAVHPNNFEALSVYAYIEAQLQDYPVAAEAYRRALNVQESPALRAALARLPVK